MGARGHPSSPSVVCDVLSLVPRFTGLGLHGVEQEGKAQRKQLCAWLICAHPCSAIPHCGRPHLGPDQLHHSPPLCSCTTSPWTAATTPISSALTTSRCARRWGVLGDIWGWCSSP